VTVSPLALSFPFYMVLTGVHSYLLLSK